jgi:CBS domain containing-hemolysin-like protein
MIYLTVWQLFALVPPLILVEGFFSGSEIALLSADKLTLMNKAKAGDPGAALALELASHPERVFSTTLLMTSLCVICTSALISIYFQQMSPEHSELLAVLITSPLVVLFGEMLPKTVYQRQATTIAPWIAYPVSWTYWAFFPITRILASYTTRLSRIIGPIEELLAGRRKTTRDEIRNVLSYTKSETEISASEKKMIKRIFDFRYTEAKHALIPLVRVDAIEDTATVQEALESFERHRHSRMPVYSNRIDNIIGILESSDLLVASDLKQPIRLYVTPPHYVAETQFLEDLLSEMKRDDNEMVVVVDEYGGAVGILTFEDIIEEIVGEISDEYDYESLPFKLLEDNKWIVQAKMEIQEINETLKLELPQGDYETLSGFLLQQFSRIPEARDELFFDTPTGSYKFTIQKASERQIESVVIQRMSRNE